MRRFLPTAGPSRAATALASLLALASPATLVARPSAIPHEDPATVETTGGSFPSNYDIRFDLAAERAGKIGMEPAQQRAIAKMGAHVDGFNVTLDEVSALPKTVSALVPGARLAKAGNADAVVAARNFLSANRDAYRLSSADLASLDLVYLSEPKPNDHGAIIARFAQKVDGVPVWNAEIAVCMTRDHAVVGTSGVIYPNAAVADSKVRSLSMNDAMAKSASDLSARVFNAADFEAGQLDDAGYTLFSFGPDRSAGEDGFFSHGLRVERVIFPISANEAVPAYYVEVHVAGVPEGSGPYFSYVISAENGAVLFRNNLTASDTYQYRAFVDPTSIFRPFDSPQGINGTPHPTGVPDQFQAAYALENDITIESLLGPTDPWLAPNATTTLGNNVEAFLDLGNSTQDVHGIPSAPGQFLYTLNPTLATTDPGVRQAKITHLFVFNNWCMTSGTRRASTRSRATPRRTITAVAARATTTSRRRARTSRARTTPT